MEGLVEGSVLWKLNSNTVESLFVIYLGFCSFVCMTFMSTFCASGCMFYFGPHSGKNESSVNAFYTYEAPERPEVSIYACTCVQPHFHSPPLSWSPSVSRFVFTRHCGWCWATVSGGFWAPLSGISLLLGCRKMSSATIWMWITMSTLKNVELLLSSLKFLCLCWHFPHIRVENPIDKISCWLTRPRPEGDLITELHEFNQITKGSSCMDALQWFCRSVRRQNAPGPTRTRHPQESPLSLNERSWYHQTKNRCFCFRFHPK